MSDPPDRSRCPEHGLALSPSGGCMLCERERGRSHKGVTYAFLFLGAALVLVVAGGLAYRGMVRMGARTAPTVIEPEPPGRGPSSKNGPQARSHPAEPTPPAPGAMPATPVAEPSPRPAIGEPAAPEPPINRQQQAVNDQAELAMARRRVAVTVYATSWCPVCDRLRDWLRQNRISFREHDVDDDPRAREAQRRLNPRGSVPTVDIDGQVLVGFSPQRIAAVIDWAARERIR